MAEATKTLGSFAYHGMTFTLSAGGEWSGPEPGMVEILNGAYSPDMHTTVSSAVLPFGFETIQAAAKAFGDPSPILPQLPPSEPDTVH